MIATMRSPRLTHRRVDSFAAWQAYSASSRPRLHCMQAVEATLANATTLAGWCHVCRCRSRFSIASTNLREDLPCAGCGLNNRLRASVWLLEKERRPAPDAPIYITEQVTGLYALLASRYSSLQGSEYLGSAVPFGESVDGVRNESLTELTFAPGSFSHLLSFEVFEHIPDYRTAFAECARVLRKGGRMVFSAPFLCDAQTTLVRARMRADGSVEHILAPEYHGDPLTDDGCLCFQHFGWDILDDLRRAGFARAWACVYWSLRFGYVGGEQVQFVAVR